MIIQGSELMKPEELTQLGALFDEAWVEVRSHASDSEADRAALAAALLRLARLKQLGPEQMKATAVRIFRCEQTASGDDEAAYRSMAASTADDGSGASI